MCVFGTTSSVLLILFFAPTPSLSFLDGQNLAKLHICGAQCHLFDLGGSFQDLWKRYYSDCDAVIFCWRLHFEEEDQQVVLEHVRQEIADDVPFLIFAHVFDDNNDNDKVPTTTTLDTREFLPRYTSNMMHVSIGSAKTGQGVREAMEWLIPLAKRQARLRTIR